MTKLACGASTDTGLVRELNQDCLHAGETVFAVADGLGGHSGGEVASAIAVEVLASSEPTATIGELIDLAHEANERISQRAASEPGLWDMGTTLSALALLADASPPRLGIVNVGDSRICRLDAERLVHCTLDHSFVEQLVREGSLSREEADVHPERNLLTRALGLGPLLVDAWELAPVVGDRYLICSDGLVNELDDDEIAAVLAAGHGPQQAADLLVRLACDAGGRDNVTVVVVDIVEGAGAAGPPAVGPQDRVLSEHLDVSAHDRQADLRP